MDRPQNHTDLQAIWNERSVHHSTRIAQMNEIKDAVEGELPQRFNRIFGPSDIPLELRMMRMAEDDLTWLGSKVFPIEAEPYSDAQSKRDEAEKVERVAYGWYNGSTLRGTYSIDFLMTALLRDQIRYADAVVQVYPDYIRKLLFLVHRDPRTHLPPVGWNPLSPTPLNGTMFAYKETLGALKERYDPDRDNGIATDLDNAYGKSTFGYKGNRIGDDSIECDVAEYYHDDVWYVATVNEPVRLVETTRDDVGHPGSCSVISFAQYGMAPLFAGQIGLEVAAHKVLSQGIKATDRQVHAPIVGPRLIGEFNWSGYNTVDDSVPQSLRAPTRLAPESPQNNAQTLSMLHSLIRLGNRHPESLQGAGDANSAKALNALQGGPRGLLQGLIWMPFKSGFRRVFDTCIDMELKLWPNEKRTARGTKDKVGFEIDYTPIKLLPAYRGRVSIEEGFGLGGYQQTLEAMQLKDSGIVSEDFVREQHPGIRDSGREGRRVAAQRVGEMMRALIESGQGGPLSPRGLMEVKTRIEKGESEAEAWAAVHEAGLLYEQPPAPEAAPPDVPPELAAMLGGGAPEMPAGAPSLSAARGF